MKLEVVVLPVAEVDRPTEFSLSLGIRLDHDVPGSDGFHVVQLTPPGSTCSIILGNRFTGSCEGLRLVADDVQAAPSELITNVDVG